MTIRAPRVRLPQPAADVALAALFVVVSQVELHHRVDDGYQAGPMWLNAPLVLLMAAPLAMRSRAPGVAAAIALSAACLPGLVVAHTIFFWGSMVPIAILTYTLARRRDTRAARHAWAVGPLLLLANMPHVAELRTPSNVVFGVGVYGLAWLVGRVLRRLEDRDVQLRTALERLSGEQALREQAAVAAERSRIAGEMHDVVAHAVTLMVVQVGAARMRLGEAAPPELHAAEDTGRQALVELRRTLGLLGYRGRDSREPLPGLGAIDGLVSRCRDAGLDLDVEVGALGDLADSVQLAAYRVVQESLTNVLRHAGPVPTAVHLARADGLLRITVRNTAGRPSQNVSSGGQGLRAMRERVGIFGGSLDAGPLPDGGFHVEAELPVVEEEPAAPSRAVLDPEAVR